MKNDRGQALVESMLLLPVIVMIFLGIVWFSRVLLTRQQLIVAARYGTDMIAMTTLSEQEIRAEIRNFLCHRWNEGRILDSSRLNDGNIIVTINDFPEIDLSIPALIREPRALARLVEQMGNPLGNVSSVDLRYEYDVPAIFRFTGKNKLVVTGRSEVLSGTGCRGRGHSRSTR